MTRLTDSARVILAMITCGLLLSILAGCSSNALSGKHVSDAKVPPAPTQFGQLTFAVQWPAESRAIPAATTSLFVRVSGTGIYGDPMNPQNDGRMTMTITRPANSGTLANVPIGYKLITIYALDSAGTMLAYGQSSATIEPEQTASAHVTLTATTAADQQIADASALLASSNPTSFAETKQIATDIVALANQAITLGNSPRATTQAHVLLALASLTTAACDLAIKWELPFDSGGAGAVVTPPVMAVDPWVAPDPVPAVRMMARLSTPGTALTALSVDGFTAPMTTLTRKPVSLQTRSRQGTVGLPVDPVAVQQDLADIMLPALTAAQTHLDDVSLTEPLEIPSPGDGNAIVLDQGDVKIVQAELALMRGLFHQLLAYDLTLPADFTISQMPLEYDANTDGRITPAEYMPAAPFGTLRATGAANMAAALVDYRTALDDIIAASDYHLQRPWQLYEVGELFRAHPNYDYYTGYSVGESTYIVSKVRDACKLMRPALDGAYTLSPSYTGLGSDVTINIPSLFTSPIQDIRAILPTFTILGPDTIVLKQGAFPDPTFGGLVPGGIPDSLLYPRGDMNVWIY